MDEESEIQTAPDDEEPQFETTPEQATAMVAGSAPSRFNRKRVLIALCIGFSVVICGGLILNQAKPKKKKAAAGIEDSRAVAQSDFQFLASLQTRAIRNRVDDGENGNSLLQEEEPEPAPEPLLPVVTVSDAQSVDPAREPVPAPQPQQQYRPPASGGGGGGQSQQPSHYKSSLVPQVQGQLFAQGTLPQQPQVSASSGSPGADYFNNAAAARAASVPSSGYGQVSNYTSQNNQENKQSFYDSSNGGAAFNGRYLGDNSIWTGTIIPAILETSINTDLPGNVLARVTQNVYDSYSGKNLLIPQGTLLIARYNSSISYAQSRIQIVWDTIIRPDGYQLDIEGAPGVDSAGMSGQAAKYDEHWFEYIKAAGIVTLFSIANSSITETAAKFATGETASEIAKANSDVVNQLSGNMVGRAMDIQPTLTVSNGTVINIMLNKTLYLPPVDRFLPTQKYILE